MVLVRKNNTSYNKNIQVYISILIITPKKYLNMYVTRKLINKDNTTPKSNTCLSTHNNKISIKISINPIVLSLLFYCYLSIVKPLWLLDSYLKNYFLWLVSFLISFSCILKISNQVILNLSSLQKCCLTVPQSPYPSQAIMQKYLVENILYFPIPMLLVY